MSSCSSCYSGLTGANDVLSTQLQMVRPVAYQQKTKEVPLLEYEAMFTQTPLAMASYPALAFRMSRADPEVLKASLSIVLAEHPEFAGRIKGNAVMLTDEGVPFTVVTSSSRSAPETLEELELLRYGDFRRPRSVRAGVEPLVTVKLTIFRDGSAWMVMCRSHALMDGSSAWSFLANWSRATRGEPRLPKHAARAANLKELLPSPQVLEELAIETLGRPLQDTWLSYVAKMMFPVITGPYDWLFLAGLTGDLERPRVRFADAEVAAIKDAATPPKGAPGDGWVSTQEALSAYILLTLAKATLPASSPGRVDAMFILDARKALGEHANGMFGSGLVFSTVKFQGILQMTLADVAGTLHDLAKKELSEEKLRKRWKLTAGAAEVGMQFDVFSNTQPRSKDSDICLFLNNQSKRQMPDFGPKCGGVPDSVLTNAGPTLWLPVKGGVEVFLDPGTTLKGAKTAKDRAAAVAALRSQIPQARTHEGQALMGGA